VRGALVIYDPKDPHKSLYDVDDGKFDVKLQMIPPLNPFPTDSTIITLADWYHYVSADAPLAP
jgi:iron transport multicopper oxidase